MPRGGLAAPDGWVDPPTAWLIALNWAQDVPMFKTMDNSAGPLPRSENSLPPERSERGAALVEFALVVVVLFTIVFGLIEGGLLIRASNNVSSSAGDAIRRAAVASDAADADWQVLQQLRGRGLLESAEVNYVVVYRATDGVTQPSAACLGGTPVANECNVYERADFELDRAAFDCTDSGLDGSWCPTDRQDDTDRDAISFIGLYINADYNGIFGVLGAVTGEDGVSVNSGAVMAFEGNGFFDS